MTRPRLTVQKVVSGGQTGADQAGLRAARAAGIETGGWAPLGWETEGGPAPWLSEFGLKECPGPGYRARTEANARDSDGTLWFGHVDSQGFRTTLRACRRLKKPWLIVEEEVTRPSDVLAWFLANAIQTLNVAGNRECTNPGLGSRAEAFLRLVFSSSELKPETNQAGGENK